MSTTPQVVENKNEWFSSINNSSKYILIAYVMEIYILFCNSAQKKKKFQCITSLASLQMGFVTFTSQLLTSFPAHNIKRRKYKVMTKLDP